MSEVGRPTVMDELVLQKLEWAFLRSYSDREACFHAGISPATLYSYQESNPEYSERKAVLKDSPKMKSKDVIYSAVVDGDKNSAQWILERRDPDYVKKSETKQDTTLKVEGLTSEQALELAKTPEGLEELEKIANDKE